MNKKLIHNKYHSIMYLKSLIVDPSSKYVDIKSEEFGKCESISIDYALI